jgi:hypothetical protein
MKYKTKTCGLLCQLSRYIRRNKWAYATHGTVTLCSYSAIRTHYSKGAY